MIARVRLCYCEEGIVEYDVKSLEIKPDGTLVMPPGFERARRQD